MRRKTTLTLTLLLTLATLSGCAYRYYLGMHGPSIRNTPETHDETLRDDGQCLKCHQPGQSDEAPATTHPGFKGCLNCHQDPKK